MCLEGYRIKAKYRVVNSTIFAKIDGILLIFSPLNTLPGFNCTFLKVYTSLEDGDKVYVTTQSSVWSWREWLGRFCQWNCLSVWILPLSSKSTRHRFTLCATKISISLTQSPIQIASSSLLSLNSVWITGIANYSVWIFLGELSKI